MSRPDAPNVDSTETAPEPVAGSGSTLHGFAKSVSQTLGVNLLAYGCNFAAGIITARTLGSDGRGQLVAVMLAPTLAASIVTLGVPSGLIYHIRRKSADAGALYGSGVLTMLLAGLISASIACLIIPWWLDGLSAELRHFAQIYVFTTPISLIGLSTMACLEARGEFLLRSAKLGATAIGYVVSLGGLWLVGLLSPVSAALAHVIVSFVTLLPLLIHLHRQLRPRLAQPIAHVRLLLSFGLKSYVGTFVTRIGSEADRSLLAGFLSASELGLYSIAVSVASVPWMLHTAVTPVLFPALAGSDRAKVPSMISRSSGVTLVLMVAASVGLLAIAPWVVPFVYGPEFAGLTLLIGLLLLRLVLMSFCETLSVGLTAIGRPGVNSALQFVIVPLMIVLLFLAIPRYGLLGAAGAIAIAMCVRAVLLAGAYPLIVKLRVPVPTISGDDMQRLWDRFAARRLRRGGAS
ncbi:MAG: oligosaccharide flippase family protein [Planctomycetota bacterium]